MQMNSQERKSKVAELIKNADLYDLIKISLKSTDSKMTAVDRYIQRALDRQQNQSNLIIDDCESLQDVSQSQFDSSVVKLGDNRQLSQYLQQKQQNCDFQQQENQNQLKEQEPYTEKTQERVSQINKRMTTDSKQSSPSKKSVIVYSQKVNNHQRDVSKTASITPERSQSQFMKKQVNPAENSMRQSMMEIKLINQEDAATSISNYNSEDQVPSPKRVQPPQPIQKVDKSALMNDSIQQEQKNVTKGNENTAASQRRYQQQQHTQQSISSEIGLKRNITPTRSDANYAKQTLSSHIKKKNPIPEDLQVNLKQAEQKYESRASNLYQSNKSLTRSISSSIVQKENNQESLKSQLKQFVMQKDQIMMIPQIKDVSSLYSQQLENDEVNSTQIRNFQQDFGDTSTQPSQKPQCQNPKFQKKSHQQLYEELVQKQVQKVTQQFLKKPHSKKQKMLNSFGQINLSLFVEIGRIKKPQKYAFQAGRMLCLLVNSFREKPVSEEEFTNWVKIQQFVGGNVNKFAQEVIQIKNKVIEQSNIYKIDSFVNMNNEFFNDQNLNNLKNAAANKSLQIIVCFVFNVVQYILAKELGKEDYYGDELSGQNTQDQQSICDQGIPSSNFTNDETPKSTKRNELLDNSNSPFQLNNQSIKQRDVQQIVNQPKTTKTLAHRQSQQLTLNQQNVSPKPQFAIQASQHQKQGSVKVGSHNNATNQSPFRMPFKNKFTNSATETATINPQLFKENQDKSQTKNNKSNNKSPINHSIQNFEDKSNSRIQQKFIQKKQQNISETIKKEFEEYSSAKKSLNQVCSMSSLHSTNQKQQNNIKSPGPFSSYHQQEIQERKKSKSPANRKEFCSSSMSKSILSCRQSTQNMKTMCKLQNEDEMKIQQIHQEEQQLQQIFANDISPKFQEKQEEETVTIVKEVYQKVNKSCLEEEKDLKRQDLRNEESPEDKFQFSPSKMKQAISEQRGDITKMIIEKSYLIESNMNLQISPSRKIDISIIEELKRKRQAQRDRLTGQELEQKREEIIQEVQRALLNY